jgi:hypothetical protein
MIKTSWLIDTGDSVTVFASKLAGCIGMNKYVDKDDMIDEYNALRKSEAYKTAQEENTEKIKNMDIDDQVYINNIIGKEYDNVETLNKVLDSLTEKYKDTDLLNHIKSELYKKQGIKEEENIRQHVATKNNIGILKNDKFISHHMFTINNVDIRIGGRHDGLSSDGSIVEIKNRMNRFLGVPLYELVQIHAYMVIFGAKQSIHVENYMGETRETVIPFDSQFWDDVHSSLFNLFNQLMIGNQ